MASRRTLTIGIALAVVVAALLTVGYWAIYESPPQSNKERAEAPKEKPPQLHCVLIGYTGAPRVAFLFNISRAENGPRFEQVYLIENLGSDRITKEPPFPAWRFDASDEPARLESEISVFDNSMAGSHTEKIAIELYDYRPERGSKGFIEAGLKNIHYQNLSGTCQQSRPAPLISTRN